MTGRSPLRLTPLLAGTTAALILLGGCHKAKPAANSLDAMDNDLVDNVMVAETPANRALAAEITVDPARTSRRARGGASAMHTETGAGSAVGGGSGCLAGLVYGNDWAAKLPADLPMHPSARLQEAAGHDGACQARVVSFSVPGDRGQVIGWYADKARASGYSTGRDDKGGDWILAGDKGPSAYAIIVGPTAGGATPVDYVWANGG